MFNGCISLTSIRFSDIIDNDAPIVNMNGFVSGCTNLSTVNALGVNTSSVTDLGYVFYGDANLNTANLYGWDVRNVRDMSHIF